MVTHDQNNTCFRITDQGAGLSPEDLGRLFGRFQRLPPKPTAGESSTGLGLSIVREVALAHGGAPFAARRAGGGSVIGFTVGADLPEGRRGEHGAPDGT